MIAFLSGLFVLIWATGFIVAGIVAGRADPITFLALRFACSIVVFTALSFGARAAWPRDPRKWRDALIAGMLLHGFYTGGVFWAVSQGLGPGLTGLVTALHPFFTAMLAIPLLHERLLPRQWVGIAIGVVGVALILEPRIASATGVPLFALVAAVLATLSFTLGTIWQKRTKPDMDLRVNAAIQFVGATVLTAPIAFAVERNHFDGSPAIYGALAWAVLGLSVGGISILLVLLKRGAASKVAPLLYLAPGVSAFMAVALFGEALAPIQIGGMVLAVVGAFTARS